MAYKKFSKILKNYNAPSGVFILFSETSVMFLMLLIPFFLPFILLFILHREAFLTNKKKTCSWPITRISAFAFLYFEKEINNLKVFFFFKKIFSSLRLVNTTGGKKRNSQKNLSPKIIKILMVALALKGFISVFELTR